LDDDTKPRDKSGQKHWNRGSIRDDVWEMPVQGRFPANLILDDSDCVKGLFPDTKSGGGVKNPNSAKGVFKINHATEYEPYESKSSQGSAARFFYCAKPSPRERNAGLDDLGAVRVSDGRTDGGVGGENPRNRTNQAKVNHHPTVKSIALMEYLIKMISREGQTVLDPFTGSGTTGVACKKLNRNFIGCELHTPYFEIAIKRIAAVDMSMQTTLDND